MKWVSTLLKWFVFAAVVAFAVWAKRSGFFEAALQAVHSLGFWAAPAFLAIYILSYLLFFPSLVMTCAAGVLFPVPLAIFLSLLGTSCGSVIALAIGRYGLRDWASRSAARSPQFQKLNAAIRREGWKVALLARLTPVFPFSIGNYLFGASSIPVWLYAWTAFLGTIPSASVYVWIGHMTGNTAGNHSKTPLEWALLGLGIGATVVLTVYLKHFFERIFNPPDTRAQI